MKHRLIAAAGVFKRHRLIGVLFKLALSLIVFWLVLRSISFSSLDLMLKLQNRDLLIWSGLLILVQLALGGLRWQMITAALSPPGQRALPVGQAVQFFYISAFFNCCMPGTLGGDAVRIWLARAERLPLALSVNSVILDRITALMALGLLVVLTLPALAHLMGFNVFLALLWVALVAAFGVWLLLRIERLLLPYRQVWGVRWVLEFLECLRLLLRSPRVAAVTTACALTAHVCYCLSAWVLAQSLGIELGVMESITLLPMVMLAITLPVSIGGWGIREAGMVGMLALAGIPAMQAVLLSVQLGLLGILVALPAGLLWLAYRRRLPADK